MPRDHNRSASTIMADAEMHGDKFAGRRAATGHDAKGGRGADDKTPGGAMIVNPDEAKLEIIAEATDVTYQVGKEYSLALT
jgi:hypothetical protein